MCSHMIDSRTNALKQVPVFYEKITGGKIVLCHFIEFHNLLPFSPILGCPFEVSLNTIPTS